MVHSHYKNDAPGAYTACGFNPKFKVRLVFRDIFSTFAKDPAGFQLCVNKPGAPQTNGGDIARNDHVSPLFEERAHETDYFI